MKQTADELRAVADAYMALLADLDENNRRDIDALVALTAPDIEYEIPFVARPLVLRGREDVRDFLDASQGMFTGVSYDIERQLVDAEQQVVIIEMRSERTLLPDREIYANRYVLVFTMRDGMIANFREYVNPLPAAKLTARLNLD